MKIFTVIQKNLKVLFRSKFTSLMVLFGPLIVILLIGYAFSNFNNYKIQVGTFSEQYSELSQKYIVELSGNNFKVTKYSSQDECIKEIKYGGIHTCLVFPKDFNVLNSNNVLEFYVDPSNVNLVWMVTDEVSRKIELSSSKVSMNMTQDIMTRIDITKSNSLAIVSYADNISGKAAVVDSSVSSVNSDISGVDYDNSVPDVFSLDLASVDSASTEMYTAAKSASIGVDTLATSIRSSTAWTKVNGTTRTSIDSLMTSAQASAASLRSTLESKHNLTVAKISTVNLQLVEFDTTLKDIQTELDKAKIMKSDVSTKIGAIRADLSYISSGIQSIRNLAQSDVDVLSGIAVKDANNIVNPISTKIVPITNDKEKHVNYLFPSLLVLIVMFICLLLSSLNIVLEKNSRAYFRNFVTPTSDIVFLVSSYFTNILVVLVQLVIVFGVTFFAMDKAVLLNFGPTCLILFMAASFFVFLGMIIGYLFSSEEGVILGTISISSVFFFVSNLVMPVDALPESVKFFVDLNPFVIVSSLLKRAFLFQVPIDVLKPDLILLSIYIATSLVVLFIIQRITKLRFFYHNAQKNKKVEIAVDTKKVEPAKK